MKKKEDFKEIKRGLCFNPILVGLFWFHPPPFIKMFENMYFCFLTNTYMWHMILHPFFKDFSNKYILEHALSQTVLGQSDYKFGGTSPPLLDRVKPRFHFIDTATYYLVYFNTLGLKRPSSFSTLIVALSVNIFSLYSKIFFSICGWTDGRPFIV